MKFDYDILFEFLSEEDRNYFTAWDNAAFNTGAAFCNPNGLDAKSGSARIICLLYTSPSPRDRQKSRMPSSA